MKSKLFTYCSFTMILLILASGGLVACAGNTTNTSTSTTLSSSSTTQSTSTTGTDTTSVQSPGYIHEYDQELNYQLDYPDTWTVSSVSQKDIPLLAVVRCAVKSETFTNKEDGTSITLEVRIANCYSHEQQVSGYLPQTNKYDDLYYFIILEQGTTQVDGKEAEEIIYKAPPLVTYKKCSQIMLEVGEWAYLITYSAPSDQIFDSSHHLFDDFLNSFKTG